MNINISPLFSVFLLSIFLSGCAIFGEPTEIDETLGRSDKEIVKAAEIFSANKDWQRTIEFLGKS
jgi:outer membrane protein assembly factor BamD